MPESTATQSLPRSRNRRGRWRGALAGIGAAAGLVVLLTFLMIPFRSHMSVATAALVLVIPVVVGVVLGGFAAGVAAIALGFFVYDFVFIPPYYTVYVGAAANWVALVVYAVVMVVVAQVVDRMESARRDARARAEDTRRLFDLSETLVRDATAPEMLQTVVNAVRTAFELSGAALFLPDDGSLSLVSSAGVPLDSDELIHVVAAGVPVSMEASAGVEGGVQVVALVTSGRAVGLLALRGLPHSSGQRDLLRAFTNQLALAVERAELREEALRTQVSRETERVGQALIGAVSHDLRTPLATVKVATSTLLDHDAPVSAVDRDELLALVDAQADRLDRLVANLLDVTRIQAGTLVVRRELVSVSGLVEDALAFLGLTGDRGRVEVAVAEGTPAVQADPVLIRQVLVNLIDNALRYAPKATPVVVSAAAVRAGVVEIAVSDRGPGVPGDERLTIFQMMNRREAGGRGGLGLAIVRAFVEAHGQRVWVEDPPGGRGARFVFTLTSSGRAIGA